MADKEIQDLGLGARVAEENQTRFLNHDGTFNVYRKGVLRRGAFSPYHAILSMSWTKFYAFILGAYLFANLLFTGLYFLAGSSAFPAIQNSGIAHRFGEIFFFSIQVITTIGASPLAPATLLAKGLISLEAMVGLLGFALGAGIIFARFSNPAVNIMWSDRAVIAPYQGTTAFMVRIVNGRNNEFVDIRATVTVAMLGKSGKREFHQLDLERDSVLVFPLSWTIVHPITEKSPLWGMTGDDLKRTHAEFVVAIRAVDEDLARTVYARHSYIGDEIAVGTRFVSILEKGEDGTVFVDPTRVHETETAG